MNTHHDSPSDREDHDTLAGRVHSGTADLGSLSTGVALSHLLERRGSHPGICDGKVVGSPAAKNLIGRC